MEPTTPTAVELTDDLIDYVRKSTILVASKRLPKHVDLEDVVQHVLLSLVSRPPKFDANRGAKLETFVYGIIKRLVLNYAVTMAPDLGRGRSFEPELHGGHCFTAAPNFDQPSFMDYIDCEETRQMCLLMIEHKNNRSKVARRMNVTEGLIRYRLNRLQAKLRAAGFDPFKEDD